jgi:hypothetical protein
VVKANQVRLRPADANCLAWILYRHDWLQTPEPPRIALWDTNWENKWDSYFTGVDLECDTFGVNKTVQVFVDQVSQGTFTVNRNGRGVVHLTLTPGRGHVYRVVATDANRGLLYGVRWWTEEEPSEQANWNQNYTLAGSMADKWLKGVLLECDTFGLTKLINVEIDGVATPSSPLSVISSGRSVNHISFPQTKGRVFRLLPTDSNPGRLYNLQWIFDQEPLSLTRYETQEINHAIPGFSSLLFAHITIRSTANVTLIITTTVSETGTTVTDTYTLLSTGGAKQTLFVPFNARKGVLFKYLFTSAAAFALYREESTVMIQPWAREETLERHPFGDDDLDQARDMGISSLAAAKSGGADPE